MSFPLRYHVFICEHKREFDDPKGDCSRKGSSRIREVFKEEIEKRTLGEIARANKSGCLGTCQFGPSVVVYPEGIWYTVRNEDEAREIVTEHLVNGRVVERLRMPRKD